MRKGARSYILRTFFQKGMGLLLFLVGSKGFMGLKSWVYYLFIFLATAAGMQIVCLKSPETLYHRTKIATDSPKWDRVILLFYWLLDFFFVHYLAGLEFGESYNPLLFAIGMALGAFSAAVQVSSLLSNPHLEPTARIQKERGHKVASAGVYSVVRHPAYAAGLLGSLSMSLVFPTPYVILANLVIAVLLVIRTYLEDKMLLKGLEGYESYAEGTKYRLIPSVW